MDGGIVVPEPAPVPVEPVALGVLLGRRGRAVLEDGADEADPARSPAEAREWRRREAGAEAEVVWDGERG